ncbi:hypothetical protein GOB83_12560 [Acetobacter fabarum]|uniref:hypothetical protein n=2 Tax=Acetobacter fabarum TaxID=483199 RepID=UPI0014048A41|nr:hypothetical protein [Acetobacter fabarum]NHO42998.1 hypothetical protein [Acetobacter fabarum]
MNSDHRMSADKLAKLGRALYGERWQTALATKLGVVDRTMRRWLNGESSIPHGIEEELHKILAANLNEIDRLTEFGFDLSDRENIRAEEFNKILVAMFERGDKRWITPSGSILDVLRAFIKEGKIDNVSIACRMYFKIHGEGAANYVSRHLPGLLINNYKPISGVLNFDQFLQWSNENSNWQDEIVNSAASPDLGIKVRDLVVRMSSFKRILETDSVVRVERR